MAMLAVQLEFTYAERSRAPGALRERWRRTMGRRLLKATRAPVQEPEPEWRPRTRGDCSGVPRPCPYVSCRHHLYLDASESGGIKFNYPGLEPDQMPAEWSCSLDVADRGGATLEEIATALHVSREAVRLIEVRALDKLKRVHLRVLKGLK